MSSLVNHKMSCSGLRRLWKGHGVIGPTLGILCAQQVAKACSLIYIWRKDKRFALLPTGGLGWDISGRLINLGSHILAVRIMSSHIIEGIEAHYTQAVDLFFEVGKTASHECRGRQWPILWVRRTEPLDLACAWKTKVVWHQLITDVLQRHRVSQVTSSLIIS